MSGARTLKSCERNMKTLLSIIIVVMALSVIAGPPKRIEGWIARYGSLDRGHRGSIDIYDGENYYHVQALGVDTFFIPSRLGGSSSTAYEECYVWLLSLSDMPVIVTGIQETPYSVSSLKGDKPVYKGIITFDNPTKKTKKVGVIKRCNANTNGKKTLAEAAISLGYGRVCKEDQKNPTFQKLTQLEEEARKAKLGVWRFCDTDELVKAADAARDAAIEKRELEYKVQQAGKKEKGKPTLEKSSGNKSTKR